MLYHFIYPLKIQLNLFNLFRYITFRSFLAFFLAVILVIFLGEKFIQFVKNKKLGQVIRNDGPKEHLGKAGTPTFGGVLILFAVFTSLLISGNFFSIPLLASLFIMLVFGLLGFVDDYLKVFKKSSKGVSGKSKLIVQFSTSILLFGVLYYFKYINGLLYFPFLKGFVFDLGFFYVFFAAFVVVGSSNAVNLTDGLDGLVTGPILTSAATLGLLSYLTGNFQMANYLFIPYVAQVGELSVFCSALVGAATGFLWYNSYPAQVFMGDVGSLSLGGTLGCIAVLTKNEILFVLIGGIFVIEALSVILQVLSFKLKGQRIFKMAPLHHHFELHGWKEPKVIVRFWIISLIFAICAISTLKLR